MSRISKKLNENITIHYGNDHALGMWMDIQDQRYADSGLDEQGEGFVFEHSQVFPTDNSKMIIKDFPNNITEEVIIGACNEFYEKLMTDYQEFRRKWVLDPSKEMIIADEIIDAFRDYQQNNKTTDI